MPKSQTKSSRLNRSRKNNSPVEQSGHGGRPLLAAGRRVAAGLVVRGAAQLTGTGATDVALVPSLEKTLLFFGRGCRRYGGCAWRRALTVSFTRAFQVRRLESVRVVLNCELEN